MGYRCSDDNAITKCAWSTNTRATLSFPSYHWLRRYVSTMCGIAGFIARDDARVDVLALQRAIAALRHRGPDDEGFALVDRSYASVAVAGGADSDPSLNLPHISAFSSGDWSVGLGHRRLSILDLSAAGHQPMPSNDGTCWISYNGEIYNFLELRAELESEGVSFRTRSDTEVLVAAYRHWGEAMLGRLVGMFAFAIVDLAARRVILARDPLGIKPLYYAQAPTGLAFASEIKSLVLVPGVGRSVDPGELYRYLRFGMVDGSEHTFFRDIRQIAGGQFMTIPLGRPGDAQRRTYWSPRTTQATDLSFDEAAIELRQRLADSVKLHMRSDVPVGACLSGGVDSTAIVHFMREVCGAQQELHTFSFVTDGDPLISERPYVERVVSEVGSISHVVSPCPEDIVDDFDALVRTQDQPFGSTSIYAQYRVFQLAHEAGVKVILDGQGSDEFFGGYQTAVSARLAGLIAAAEIADAAKLWKAGSFILPGARSRMLLSALGRLLPPRLSAAVMPLVGESLTPGFLKREWFEARGVPVSPRPQGRGVNALREELLLFTEQLSLPQLLRFEDRNSMHFSIESRVPFCVPSIAEFAFSLPPDYLVSRAGTTKAVLRRALEGFIPNEVLDRPKVGFATPERAWLAALQPWVDEQIAGVNAHSAPFLSAGGLGELVASQRRTSGGFKPAVWRVLSVLRWAQLFEARFE